LEPTAMDRECLEAVRGILLELPAVREGKMFGAPSFFVGRKLFACVLEGVVGFKVPQEQARRMLDKPQFAPFQPYGKRRMREWVQFTCVATGLLAEYEDALLSAYEYVAGNGDQ